MSSPPRVYTRPAPREQVRPSSPPPTRIQIPPPAPPERTRILPSSPPERTRPAPTPSNGWKPVVPSTHERPILQPTNRDRPSTLPIMGGETKAPQNAERPSNAAERGRPDLPDDVGPGSHRGRRDRPWNESDLPDRYDNDRGRDHDSGGHSGGHGSGGHGGHGGGYDGGGYGGYGGYGHHHRHYYGCGHNSWYYGLGLHFGYRYSTYGYWGLPYFYGSYGYAPTVVRHVVYEDPQGALDLNVKPKDTEVFLNGRYVGTTGDFDGFPQYLWLSEDVHELIFYRPGYETIVREVSVRRGEVINFKFQMQPGLETPPEQLTRYGTGPTAGEQVASIYTAPGGPPSTGTSAPPPGGVPTDLRTEAGRIHFRITPAEASVYIDGRFIGIAGEIAVVESGLLMDSGTHTIQVFHPGYASDDRSFEVESGKIGELVIDLARE